MYLHYRVFTLHLLLVVVLLIYFSRPSQIQNNHAASASVQVQLQQTFQNICGARDR